MNYQRLLDELKFAVNHQTPIGRCLFQMIQDAFNVEQGTVDLNKLDAAMAAGAGIFAQASKLINTQ